MFLSLLFAISSAHAASFTYTDPNCLGGFSITSSGNIVCLATPTPPGPTPVPDPTNCTGFTKTLVMHVNIPPAGAGTGTRVFNTDAKTLGGAGAHFNSTDALVVVFQAPPTTSAHPVFTLGATHSGGSSGPSSQRTYAVSSIPCDWDGPDVKVQTESALFSKRFTAGTPQAGATDLTAGQVWYLNIKNYAFGQLYCQSTCDLFITPGFQ